MTAAETHAAYDLDGFWDEMYAAPGQPRAHYALLARRLARLDGREVERRRRAAAGEAERRGLLAVLGERE